MEPFHWSFRSRYRPPSTICRSGHWPVLHSNNLEAERHLSFGQSKWLWGTHEECFSNCKWSLLRIIKCIVWLFWESFATIDDNHSYQVIGRTIVFQYEIEQFLRSDLYKIMQQMPFPSHFLNKTCLSSVFLSFRGGSKRCLRDTFRIVMSKNNQATPILHSEHISKVWSSFHAWVFTFWHSAYCRLLQKFSKSVSFHPLLPVWYSLPDVCKQELPLAIDSDSSA